MFYPQPGKYHSKDIKRIVYRLKSKNGTKQGPCADIFRNKTKKDKDKPMSCLGQKEACKEKCNLFINPFEIG